MGGMHTGRAKELRKNTTEAEQTLWKHLRMRQLGGYKFRRQQPIGPYIVDFMTFERSLIVELDGGQHSQQVTHDSKRTAWLEAQGYRVLRFWNNQVLEETEAVKTTILAALEAQGETPHLNPPPQGGRRSSSLGGRRCHGSKFSPKRKI